MFVFGHSPILIGQMARSGLRPKLGPPHGLTTNNEPTDDLPLPPHPDRHTARQIGVSADAHRLHHIRNHPADRLSDINLGMLARAGERGRQAVSEDTKALIDQARELYAKAMNCSELASEGAWVAQEDIIDPPLNNYWHVAATRTPTRTGVPPYRVTKALTGAPSVAALLTFVSTALPKLCDLAELGRRVPELEGALQTLVDLDDEAKSARGKPGACLNGLGLVDLFDSVNHPFGVGEHKQCAYRSTNLEAALVDARAALSPSDQTNSSAVPTGSQTEHSSGGLESAEPERRPAGTPATPPPPKGAAVSDMPEGAAEALGAIAHHSRHPWAQPGDVPNRVWILRFDDNDMREMIWTDEHAEADAWKAYRLYSTTWNVTLYCSAEIAAAPSPSRPGHDFTSLRPWTYIQADEDDGDIVTDDQTRPVARNVTPADAELILRSIQPPAPSPSRPEAKPVDMVLFCPACGLQHIDRPEVGLGVLEGTDDWANPPHRSHLCHRCGHIWRPADVPTNGVEAVQTRGKADSPLVACAPFAFTDADLKAYAIELWRDLCEKDDRTSPADYPEMCLITYEEFRGYLVDFARGDAQ
jgi:hypothetical protein